ncbi:GntR family transcriptional regulator [Nocardia donostiensis]|uniref:GntR family transcriptional regulator n=1 Tax=Nocardia donostiensis TaxID=1538463 RepID=A0A1V2TE90_9NOCA|nr:GntR family transcriptional regulator [Nocardia donostiensis]ONM47819.1 GntR family transcriptional regulator [Nocardia donostiensis]OQS13749.1 GntR family transcriptional regulator [Nocardia donostiensis]OQS22571.1 GntR family transcriptional regulator [Nocardia donostiensis]
MSVVDFEPVNQQSTAEMIADRLREAIMRGGLEPGAQLGEADLAAQFGVSRGPVREAMQRLVSEGLLRSIRHRGIFVIDLTHDDVADIYRARTAIESGALTLILDGRRHIAYQALEPSVTHMNARAAAGDAVGVSDADQAFHEALVASAGSPRLVRAARTLLIETRMCLGALQTTYPDLREQAREHVELREAIGSGPEERAHSLLAEHMHDAVHRLCV